jgi:hypothetical protein
LRAAGEGSGIFLLCFFMGPKLLVDKFACMVLPS